MSPHKVQFLTLTTGVRISSVVKKILQADHAQKIGLQKFTVTWKHLKRAFWQGGDIEGALKIVDLEKILSQIY